MYSVSSFFGDQLFWTPNFSNLQYLRVKAPLFFVDRTRAFGGVCKADFLKILTAAKVQDQLQVHAVENLIFIQEDG